MVRITACLLAGVLTGILAPGKISPSTIPFVCYCLLAAFASSLLFKFKLLAGVSALSLVGVMGYWLVTERTPAMDKDDLSNCDETVISYQVVISSFAELRANSLRTYGEVQAIKTNSGWRAVTGRILI